MHAHTHGSTPNDSVMSSTTLPQLKDGRQILKCVLVIVPANSFKGLDDALVINWFGGKILREAAGCRRLGNRRTHDAIPDEESLAESFSALLDVRIY
ncbi:hypothetical protein WJX79_009435 [Trebouxia sp. C0005]